MAMCLRYSVRSSSRRSSRRAGDGADAMGYVTYLAVALLFFLYGARLSPQAIVAGVMHWRLQGLVFLATFVLFPILGLVITAISGPG